MLRIMKIAHISDIHLTENGTEIWGVNTHEHFQKAIQKIKELDGLDGIIVSGDLSRGYFNPDVLMRLLKSSNGPVAIVLHHPPVNQDGWLNRKLLENRSEFNAIIKNSEKVKVILYGHTHFGMYKQIDNVVYSSPFSVAISGNPPVY